MSVDTNPTITSTRTPEPTITSIPTPAPTVTTTRTLEPMVTPTRTPTPEPTEDKFVNYSAVKSTDTQNQVIDSLNLTDKNINQKENSKNWFERIITWLFKYNN